MVHRYSANKLVTLLQPAVDRYLDQRVTDDQPMRPPYNDQYLTATQSLNRLTVY